MLIINISASLKMMIFPSTSIKRICPGSAIFSLDLPNLLLLGSTILHHQLHFIIECLCLPCQFFHLILQPEEELNEQFFIQLMTVVFPEADPGTSDGVF